MTKSLPLILCATASVSLHLAAAALWVGGGSGDAGATPRSPQYRSGQSAVRIRVAASMPSAAAMKADVTPPARKVWREPSLTLPMRPLADNPRLVLPVSQRETVSLTPVLAPRVAQAHPAVEQLTPVTERKQAAETAQPVDSQAAIEAEGDLRDPGVQQAASRRVDAQPVYPRLSRMRGEEGTVVIGYALDDAGRPCGVHLLASSGHPRLDKAALKAMRQVGLQATGAIPSAAGTDVLQQRFRFVLEDSR